jgi:hypothetical protein
VPEVLKPGVIGATDLVLGGGAVSKPGKVAVGLIGDEDLEAVAVVIEAGELLCIDAGWNEAVDLCSEVVAVTTALAVHVAPGGTCLFATVVDVDVETARGVRRGGSVRS